MKVIRIVAFHALPIMAVTACTTLFSSAMAATTTSDSPESTLPTIVVNAKKAQPTYQVAISNTATKNSALLHDVPQTVNVVNQAVMRDQNVTSMQDALVNVPGLSASVGDGQRDQISIRGFVNIVDQFVDGVRDDALYYRDLSNIEQVEVLKGPAAVLYGRGSSGGIVNRVTKKPKAHPVKEVGVVFGSRGQKRGEFDLGAMTQDNNAQFRVTGAVEDTSSFRDGYFLNRQAIAPSALFKVSPDTTVLLQADYLHDKRLADQGVPSYHGRPVKVPIKTYYGASNGRDRTFVESEVVSGAVTLDHRFSDRLNLHSVLRAYDYTLDRNYTTPVVNESARTASLSQTRRVRDEKGYYLQNELSQLFNWGDTKHELMYGLELGQQDKSEQLKTKKNVVVYPLFNPILVDLPPLPSNLAAKNDNKSKFNIMGLYVQDFMTLSPEWKLLVGARFDRLEQERDDRTKSSTDLNRTDTTLSPRFGLVYQPIEDVSVYASYSKSFQPIADAFVFYANSDQLKPTITDNKEIGVKWDVNPQASFTTSLFEMTQSNIQNQDPNNPLLAVPIGEQRTRGVELTFSGEIAPQWDVLAGYSYMKSEILNSTAKTKEGKSFNGNEASLTPRNSFNLWIKHQLDGGYYVAVGGKAESSRFASPDDLTTLPGYGVMNLGAGYEAAQFDVTATLQNVLNRKYFVSGHSAANDYNMPGQPITLVVGARYRF
jgi:catecholate siderophore receptor